MQGTNGKGNKQVGFVTNADEWETAIDLAKTVDGAPSVSSILRAAVTLYVETYSPAKKPTRTRTRGAGAKTVVATPAKASTKAAKERVPANA